MRVVNICGPRTKDQESQSITVTFGGSGRPIVELHRVCNGRSQRSFASTALSVSESAFNISELPKRTRTRVEVGKLDGKVAVITGATSGMAVASAKLFVEEGAYVFITGRRQDNLDNAVTAIGRNVTGVQGDSAR